VVIPHIASAEHAEEVTAFAKFPPLGDRSFAGGRTTGYGGFTDAWVAEQDAHTRCLPMIEDAGALDDITEILALDTVDGVFVGPSDLSLRRKRGAYSREEGDFADLKTVADAAAAAGKPGCYPRGARGEGVRRSPAGRPARPDHAARRARRRFCRPVRTDGRAHLGPARRPVTEVEAGAPRIGCRPGMRAPTRRWLGAGPAGCAGGIGGVLGLGMFVNYIDRVSLSIATPAIMHDFGINAFADGPDRLGVPLDLRHAADTDRFDHRPDRCALGDRVGVLLWAIASFASAAAGGLGMLLVARLLLGIGEAPTVPAGWKAIGQWFPRQRTGHRDGDLRPAAPRRPTCWASR